MAFECVVSKEHPHLGGNIPGGDSFTFCPGLWDWMVPVFGIKSVLDVGCGEGNALLHFHHLGIQVVGLEGLAENASKGFNPIIVADLTKGPIILANIDLVWCCEVVEHVDAKYLDHLLATLSVGRILAMTAAEPGQPGHHHVNCQPKEYWIQHLSRFKMKYDPIITEEGKAKLPKNNHFNWHGLIFRRES